MADILGAIKRGALNVATLGAYQHPEASRQYLLDTLHSLDPRTREGALSLAATFVPGGKKGSGPLTPLQQRYLDQLRGIVPKHTVRSPVSSGTLRMSDPIWYERSKQPGVGPVLDPRGRPVKTIYATEHPELAPLVERLGYGTGRAETDLMNTLTKGQGNSFGEVTAKLGKHPDTTGQRISSSGGQYHFYADAGKMPIPRTRDLSELLLGAMLANQAKFRRN